MAKFSLPEDHPLKADPEMALILGYCLSEWDRIEHAMVLVFAGLLDTDYFKAEKVFWSQQGLRGRCNMIHELCKRPGVIDRDLHGQIVTYLNEIKTLSEQRNLLVHGSWLQDGNTGVVFRVKLRPDMLMHMLDEKNKFDKDDIKEIGARFTAFRREFVPFANRYYGAKLQEMVTEKMAVAEALNRGTTITLGHSAGGASPLESLDDGSSGHGELT